MAEVNLRRVFLNLQEDFLNLTVDDDRVYRVYCDDDCLSLDRCLNFTTGRQRIDFDNYREANKQFKHMKELHDEQYAMRLKKQRGDLTPEVFKDMMGWQ